MEAAHLVVANTSVFAKVGNSCLTLTSFTGLNEHIGCFDICHGGVIHFLKSMVSPAKDQWH